MVGEGLSGRAEGIFWSIISERRGVWGKVSEGGSGFGVVLLRIGGFWRLVGSFRRGFFDFDSRLFGDGLVLDVLFEAVFVVEDFVV